MLFNLAQTLRSLTTSPISTVDQAHRMAQRRLEADGPAVSARSRVDDGADARDFVLPLDVDPVEVATAMRRSCAMAEVRQPSAATVRCRCWRSGRTAAWLCRRITLCGWAMARSIAAGESWSASSATSARTVFAK
jgi:hypothetical protein